MKISQYARKNNVTIRTVWNWIYKNKINYERKHGHINILEDKPIKPQKIAIYARVSSAENKTTLDTQVERLISYANAKGYKVEIVVKEIASGLNDNRPKLEKLLLDDSITHIIVEHKDRLARFGLNYIIKLLAMRGCTVEIINNVESKQDELIEDFVSIITSFCARIYGNRRSKRKTEQLIKELQNKD